MTWLSRRSLVIVLLVVVAGVGTVAAGTCGNGIPCRPVPWDRPRWPDLSSPTPVSVDANYSGGPTPTATTAPTATGTFAALDDIDNVFATLQAQVSATPMTISVNGTPMMLATASVELASNATGVYGYVVGLFQLNLGPLAPLVAFAMVVLGLPLVVRLTLFLLPLLAAVVGIIRRLTSWLLDFIPF